MSRRTLVWLTAVIAAALAVATTLITNRAGTQPITVTAHFEDAIGLYEGNTVAVLGMRVGHVDRITTKGEDRPEEQLPPFAERIPGEPKHTIRPPEMRVERRRLWLLAGSLDRRFCRRRETGRNPRVPQPQGRG